MGRNADNIETWRIEDTDTLDTIVSGLDPMSCDRTSPDNDRIVQCIVRAVANTSQKAQTTYFWSLASYVRKFYECEHRNMSGYSETPLGQYVIKHAEALVRF